jgi:hypothetical protein
MPTIIIEDFSNVIIDGINRNDVFAAIRNSPEHAAEIESAALLWAVGAANAGKDAATLAASILKKDTELAAVTAECARLAALLAEASAAFDAGDVAKLTTMRAAALQTESEKKLAAALAKKAEAEAEIAALTE